MDQGQFASPVSVWCYACSAVAFIQSTFAHLGNTGLSIDALSSNTLVWQSLFHDISGGGLRVGRYPTTLPTRGTVVEDNVVYDVGKEYIGSCGIFVMNTEGSVVRHNTVHDIPYTGISAGLGWTYDYNPLNVRSLIASNHVYNVMSLLCDGGGLYLNARQDGTYVAQNHIHHIDTSDLYWAMYTNVFICPGQGVYFDTGSSSNSTQVERDNIFDHIRQNGIGADFGVTDPAVTPTFFPQPAYATNAYVESHAGRRLIPVHLPRR